jgi:predicted nucleic acid-binding protein
VKAIADTGFVVAFLNRRDAHHAWAVELASHVSAPLLTCDAVLAEASFQVQNSALVLGLVQDGLLLPAFNVAEHTERLAQLAKRFADRTPDLADLCLIVSANFIQDTQ